MNASAPRLTPEQIDKLAVLLRPYRHLIAQQTEQGQDSAGRLPEAGASAVMAETDRLLYTVAEAAARLSVPESWLRKRVSARAIPHTRVGRHIRFSDEQLRRIAADGEQEPHRVTGRPR